MADSCQKCADAENAKARNRIVQVVLVVCTVLRTFADVSVWLG